MLNKCRLLLLNVCYANASQILCITAYSDENSDILCHREQAEGINITAHYPALHTGQKSKGRSPLVGICVLG